MRCEKCGNMVDTPQHELGCLPKLRQDPRSGFYPYGDPYEGKAFVMGYKVLVSAFLVISLLIGLMSIKLLLIK